MYSYKDDNMWQKLKKKQHIFSKQISNLTGSLRRKGDHLFDYFLQFEFESRNRRLVPADVIFHFSKVFVFRFMEIFIAT